MISDRQRGAPIDRNKQMKSLYRLLDASLNRICEGLRTLEDVSRFVLDDRSLSESFKQLRHDLQILLAGLQRIDLLASRDAAGDVGTDLSTPSESARVDLAGIVAAAASRCQQSLRVIEETVKLITTSGYSPPDNLQLSSAGVEQIRYRLYDVSAALELRLVRPAHDRCSKSFRTERLQRSRLYGLVSGMQNDEIFATHVRRLCVAGVEIIQVRDKQLDDRTLYERCRIAASISLEFEALLIINDRADIAIAVAADGVHVGQDELPPREVRRIVGTEQLIGLSTHDVPQATAAASQPVDYIGCGPIFSSGTKSFDSYTGTGWLAELDRSLDLPVFAIGGINLANVHQVVAAGIKRVAVSGLLLPSNDLESSVATMLRMLHDEQ